MSQDFDWLQKPAAPLFAEARAQAAHRQTILTKPPGALGRLEEVAISLCAMQGYEYPRLDDIYITVFAGDHGIAAKGVSAFPQAVTGEMVKNFAAGGAAISVLARELGAELEVINLGTVNDPGPLKGVTALALGPGTADFCAGPAMSAGQLVKALAAGRDSVQRAIDIKSDLFIGGEMGIGNTSSAAAIACALLDKDPQKLAGPGTGLDQQGVERKAKMLKTALELHKASKGNPLEILRCLGGFEIAALTGAYIACAQQGLPVLVDGFISSVAALVAKSISKDWGNWFFYAHSSAEPGHVIILEALNAKPLLDLGMRLGEGSGAGVAVAVMRMACALHNDMATFEAAGVSEKEV